MNTDAPMYVLLGAACAAVLVGLQRLLWRLVVRSVQRQVSLGNRATAIARLEALSAVAFLATMEQGYSVLFHLTNLYLHEKRYQETVATCRRFLKAKVPARYEVEVRKRLADALDGLERTDEANDERATAMQRLQGHGTDYQTLGTQGQLYERESRFSEAYDAYEQGLSLTPRAMKSTRLEYMCKLMLAATHSGQREKALKWAEMAIASGASGNMLALCHRQAGIGCKTLGRIDDAETHYRKALTIAESISSPSLAGKALAQLASLELNRGRMTLAMDYADKAIALSPEEARTAHIFKVECLRVLGRFEEAVEHQAAAARVSVLSVSHFERRSQGIMAIGMAWLAADMNDAPKALRSLTQASELLQHDEMLRLWCDATRAWISALAGDPAETARLLGDVKARAMRYPDDRNTQLTCCACPGRGAFLIGDYESCRSLFTRYLELTSSKAWTPLAHYYLGASAEALGETDQARTEFERGAAFGDDLHYARCCAAKLADLPTTPTPPFPQADPHPPQREE